jgi:hypothetical protein
MASLFAVFDHPLLAIPFAERQLGEKHPSKGTGIDVQL